MRGWDSGGGPTRPRLRSPRPWQEGRKRDPQATHCDPWEVANLQGKDRGAHEALLLGSQDEVNRPFSPTIRRRLAWGVQDGDHGPFRRSSETPVLQGKRLEVHDSRPLGSGMDSFAFSRKKY